MVLVFKRSVVLGALALLTWWQCLAPRKAVAANNVCGVGRIVTLAIESDVKVLADRERDVWLKIEPEYVNHSIGSPEYQYLNSNLIRLGRGIDGDTNLFQRQMLILMSAFVQNVPVRIISDKVSDPKCIGVSDDFQIATCEDSDCDTVG